MIQGGFLSPIIQGFFSDPATGAYSPEFLRNFLSQVETNQMAFDLWNYIKRKAAEQRVVSNFSTLVAAGFNTADFEVAGSVKAANTATAAKLAVKPYYTIADSLVAPVKDAAIKDSLCTYRLLFIFIEALQVHQIV